MKHKVSKTGLANWKLGNLLFWDSHGCYFD